MRTESSGGTPAGPGVGRRRPGRLRHQLDGFERILDAGGPLHGLAHADDDRESGVDGHGANLRFGPLATHVPYNRGMPWPSDSDPDRELFALIDDELRRQNTTLQLIASENFTSPAVLRATGSVLTNKYSEGYPGKRYYGGNQVIDEVEELARQRAKELFGAEHANVQPHSGANANMAVYLGLLEPGDTVMGLSLDHGGHLTHGSPVNASGKLYRFVSYKLSPSDERIDMDAVRDAALEHRPQMIVAGATAYPRRIDPEPFRAICDEVGA